MIYAMSESSSRTVKEKTILDWHISFKKEIQNFILKYLSGFFISWGTNKKIQLPSVDIYKIINKNSNEDFFQFYNTAKYWLDLFYVLFSGRHGRVLNFWGLDR